jgi:hypothetical protein
VVPTGHPGINHTLGLILIAENNPTPGNQYTFFDQLSVDVLFLTNAYYPDPEDNEKDVPKEPTLSWSVAGWTQDTNGHEIYFGTSWAEVNSATTSSDAFQGAQDRDANTWSVLNYDAGGLDLGVTYYWRIDEVNTGYAGTEPPTPPNGRWKSPIWSFRVAGHATNPVPADRASDVSYLQVLNWTPGIESNSHDVYIGTDYTSVQDANYSSSEFKGQQSKDNNDYTADIALGGTYFWRVDEVNQTAGTLLKGDIWRFTVEEYVTVDRFNTYELNADIRKVWKDGYTNSSGSSAFVEAVITVDGNAMKIEYDNSAYPESIVTAYTTGANSLPIISDWELGAVKALVVNFRGLTGNADDPLYVKLTDGDGSPKSGKVTYPDTNDLKRELWKQWNIEMAAVPNGVNIANIDSITIGFEDKNGQGTAYFDNIGLYPARCVPDLVRDQGAFRSEFFHVSAADCHVDLGDHAAYARDWAGGVSPIGSVTASAPADTNLVGYWLMNDNLGDAVVLDSSANTYHGTLYDAYDAAKATWSTGKTKNHDATGRIDGALSFDGIDDMVNLPVFDLNSNKVTISAWIKRDGESQIYSGIVFSADANTLAGLALGSKGGNADVDWAVNNELCYYWDGFYWDWHSELIVPDGIWTLVALTVSPDKAVVYLHDGVNLLAATNYASHATGV